MWDENPIGKDGENQENNAGVQPNTENNPQSTESVENALASESESAAVPQSGNANESKNADNPNAADNAYTQPNNCTYHQSYVQPPQSFPNYANPQSQPTANPNSNYNPGNTVYYQQAPYQNRGYQTPPQQNYNYGYGSANAQNGSYAYSYTQQGVNPGEAQAKENGKLIDKKGFKFFLVALASVLVLGLVGFIVSELQYDDKPPVGDENTGPTSNYDSGLILNDQPATAQPQTEVNGALTPPQIAEKVKPSVVAVIAYKNGAYQTEGTGILMSEDNSKTYTYILTNAHIISAATSAKIQFADEKTLDAIVVGLDTRTDLAVLKIQASGLPVATFGNSDALKVGDSVYAIGNPGGTEFFGSFTSGVVSAIDRPITSSSIGYEMKCIQHDAAISPGNSGGPLVNVFGQVIGINSSKISGSTSSGSASYEGMSFAIPISSAKKYIDDIIANGYVTNRPKLGITYYYASRIQFYSNLIIMEKIPEGSLVINEISSDSALSGSQVQRGDVITKVNGAPLKTANTLSEEIAKSKVGDAITLTVARSDNKYNVTTFDVTVKLVEDKGDSLQKPETTTNIFSFFGDDSSNRSAG